MRRQEKEIIEKGQIEAVIHNSLICRIGLSDNNIPYIVPLCFGYRDNTIYLHSSLKGKKINILKTNQNVCFEFDTNVEIVKAEDACKWGMRYRSVIGFGKASFLEDPQYKREALNIIMDQYAGKAFQFPDSAVKGTAVIKIEIASITGKQSGFK